MKTKFEKADVSRFRSYVRNKRFNPPKYKDNLISLLARLEKGDAPAIGLIIAKSDQKAASESIDVVGIGKTDFAYFATNFIRDYDDKTVVLAFPDVLGQVPSGLSFFYSIFVPEVLRLTETSFDKVYDFFQSVWLIGKSLVYRMVLFIRVNVILTIALLAFFIGAISLDDILVHQSELLAFVHLIATPLALTIAVALWLIVVWDKIKKDEKYKLEWDEYSVANLRYVASIDLTKISLDKLVRRLCKRNVIIILDDASHIDAPSLNSLIELVSKAKDSYLRKWTRGNICLVLITDVISEEVQGREFDKSTHGYLSEFKCRRNNWLCFDLTPPTIDDIEWILWGFYNNAIPWKLVKGLVEQFPALENNTGFLLQFLYDETTILENQKGDLAQISPSKLLEDYKTFAFDAEYRLLAESVLSKIAKDVLVPCKEFLKYVLAFESPLRNSEIIHLLMEEGGVANPRKIGEILIANQILRLIDGNYKFVKRSDKYTLILNWYEWAENQLSYYTKVFNKIHDYSSNNKLKDNPQMARNCEASLLVVDTLWREGDALWFYGGNANIQTALEYYGYDNKGALSKWISIFRNDLRNNNLADENFYWRVDAKNSPFRHKTNRSVRSDSFIGDLIQVSAALYFSAGAYEKAFYMLNDLWDEIRNSCLNSSDVSDKIKNKVKSADPKIQIQLSEYLIGGPILESRWKLAVDKLNQVDSSKLDANYQFEHQALLWRIEYCKRYSVGNLPSTLLLVRDAEVDKVNEPAIVKVASPKLALAQLYLYHYRDLIRLQLENPGKKAELNKTLFQIKTTLTSLDENLINFGKRANKALQLPYPLLEHSSYPIADSEHQIILYKGLWNYFTGLVLYYEYYQLLDDDRYSSATTEIGRSIRNYYDICEKMWNEYYPILARSNNYEDLVLFQKAVADTYGKFAMSDGLKRQELSSLQNKIRENGKVLLRQIERGFYIEALKLLKLSADLASIRLQKHNEILACYYQGIVLTTLMLSNPSAEHEEYLERLMDLIAEFENDSVPYVYGYANDSLRYHIRIAEYIGEKRFEEVYQHYSKARRICQQFGSCLPSIVKGEIVSHQLSLVGNVGTFVAPDEIFTLANQALEIFNSFLGDELSSIDLESHKALVRWWIAEACARLAKKESNNYDGYFERAKQHWNWIQKQSQENETLKKYYVPKVKQVQAQFCITRGDYKQAVSLLREALDEFDDNLFEQIQTLEQIIEYDLAYLRGNNNKKEVESFLGNISSFRTRLFSAIGLFETEQKINDMLFYKTTEGAATFAHAILVTKLRNNSEMVVDAIRLWLFSINGFLDWKMAGRAAIEITYLKELSNEGTSIKLPIEFDDLVRRCVLGWDPRREQTNKTEVEKALGSLVGAKINIQGDVEKSKDKNRTLEQVHILLSRPTPDTNNAYQVLKNALEVIDVSDPVSEDIELIRLLIICCNQEEYVEKVEEYKLLFSTLSNSLASKVYLEIANAFSDTPEIRDRYLHMAATVSDNKFSDEANREITRTLNIEGVRKPDLTKDELEKTNFLRLINLRVEDYDITEAYNLLYLFENELRRLITYQFNQRSGWWKKGIPNDIFDKVAKENNERVKGTELLNQITLGELFKVIRYGDNWEQVFEIIFYSLELLKARESIILPVRNRIAHTDRNLSIDLIREYVIAAKNMIKQMQPFLPE